MHAKQLVCVVLFLCVKISSHARDFIMPVYSDAGMWNTFSINYAWNKRVTLLFTEEFRLRENYSRLNLFYTNLGVEYKVSRHVKTNLVYRWINKYQEDNTFSFRHRLQWDITAKAFYKKFTLAYRHRLQVEARNIYTSENGRLPEWYSRHKADLSYDLNNKISPYVSVETRYQLFDPRNEESDRTWHRIRFQGGVDYTYSKKSKFGIYYLIQKEFNVSASEDIYITGLEYTLNLKRK